nr:hypothetical protein [Tanacetum cinerariifolium]
DWQGMPTLALVEKDESPTLVERDETLLASQNKSRQFKDTSSGRVWYARLKWSPRVVAKPVTIMLRAP